MQGERLALRSGSFAASAPVAGPRGIALPAPVANADWTHRGGGADHALGHVALGPTLAPLFAVAIGEGLEHHLSFAYGDHRDALRAVGARLGLPVLELC